MTENLKEATPAASSVGKAKNRKFGAVSIVLATTLAVVSAGAGFWAGTKSPASIAASLPNSPLSKVQTSKTIEGYEEQAQLAFGRNEITVATDAWQQAFDRAITLKFTAAAQAKLYMKAGDTVSGLAKDDTAMFGRGAPTAQNRALANYYYSKALAIYIAEKLPRQELNVRYRLASLSAQYADVDELDNLRAIVTLDKESAASPTWRLNKIYYTLGSSLDEQGQYDEAAVYLEKGLRNEKSTTNNVATSQTYIALSRIWRSKREFKKLISLLKYLEDRRDKGLDYEQPPIGLLNELKAAYYSLSDDAAINKVDADIKRVLNENQ